tara:strand:- start:1262 stop:2140 length:879 start_codon:yes stop_codon:yes gene_type:complete
MISHETKPILPYTPSSLETIDFAMFKWLDDTMDVFCTSNDGWQKVPCVWVMGERSGQRATQIRKLSGIIRYPVITLERTSVTKDLAKKGMFWGNVPAIKDYKGGSITIARRIQQDKTANFLNADSARRYGPGGSVKPTGGQINFPNKKKNKKIVYEQISIPMPVYLEMNYSINVQTEYQQQMNEICQPFMTKTFGVNQFFVEKDGHRFECFMQAEFAQENNVSNMGEDRRIYVTKIDIKALGYVIGQGKNDPQPSKVIRENAVDVQIPRERTIFGDKPEWKPVQGQPGKYRS